MFLRLLLLLPLTLFADKVGLCVMATGKYLPYAEQMIESAREHFCSEHEVHFFVFTDQDVENGSDVTYIQQDRLGWPHDTLLRFDVYLKHRKTLSEMDYLFACDADMRFVSRVGSEILSDLVGTEHPGFVGKRGSYETNPESLAYISDSEGDRYFAGGFYGGKRAAFFDLLKVVMNQINADLDKGLIAVWHDESHLNRYFIDHKPTCVLSPSYCYPEAWDLPYEKRLLALDKNHNEMRE